MLVIKEPSIFSGIARSRIVSTATGSTTATATMAVAATVLVVVSRTRDAIGVTTAVIVVTSAREAVTEDLDVAFARVAVTVAIPLSRGAVSVAISRAGGATAFANTSSLNRMAILKWVSSDAKKRRTRCIVDGNAAGRPE